MDKVEAQRRVDRVRAFQEELVALEQEGVLALSDAQREPVRAHHQAMLRALAEAWDVDVTGAQRQLSWGMRIVAFLGAAALSAAVWFLFSRYWGYLGTAPQVALLVAAPVAATLGVEVAARRDRSGSFATVVALVAFASFVVDLSLLGRIFGIAPTQNAFLAWAAFAFVLAYGWDLRLLQIAGILSLLGYLTFTVGTWHGCYWLDAGERPEYVVLAGLVVAALSLVPQPRHPSFPGAYRVFGLLAALVAMLILANWGTASVLPLSRATIEHLYQVAGFVAAALVIWAGVRRRWPGTTNLGSTAFAVLLYTKIYDWWWEWMPRWIFFLVVGLVAILLLLVMRRLRTASQEVVA